jgi:hypothetical protein
MTFQPPKVISGLDPEPNRILVAAFNDVGNDLTALARPNENVTPVQTGNYVAKIADLVRAIPPAAGMSVLLPGSTVANAGSRIRIAVESVVSGGKVTVGVSGAQLINAATLATLTSVGFTEFISLGPKDGWSAIAVPGPGTIPLSSLAVQASDTFVGNVSGAPASPVAVNLSTLAGAGLVFGTHTLDVTAGAGASLVVSANDIQRGALTGAVVAAQDSNATTFGTIAANTFLANATAGVAAPTAVASNAQGVMGRTSGNIQSIDSAVQSALIRGSGSVFWAAAANNQVLCRNGAGDLGFQTLVDGNLTANTITAASQAQMAANTIKGNWTAALANEADNAVGANTVVGRVAGNVVAAQLVGAQVTAATLPLTTLATQAARTVVANATNAVASPTAVANATARQYFRSNDQNTTLEFGALADAVQATATVVSAATTVLQCTGTYTIPANTLVAGSRFLVEFTYQFVRGATATALNLSTFMTLGAVNVSNALASNTVAGTYQMRVFADFTVLTTGAGGTCMANLAVYGPGTTVTADAAARYVTNLALACNTTIALALSGAAQMSVAGVTSTTLTSTGGQIMRVA